MEQPTRRTRPGPGGLGDDDGNEVVHQQERRRISPEEAAANLESFAQTAVVLFVKRAWASPKVKVGLLFWILGFGFMIFAPPLTTVTPEMRENYEEMLAEAANIFQLDDAKAELAIAQGDVYDAQVWFWRWRSPHREIVHSKQEVAAVKQAKVDELLAIREGKLRKANAYVGIWSEYGLQDMRERFWSAFESGKVFAMRQTFWQMMMSLMSSREEHFLSTLLSWMMTALINFTMGLLGALFYFVFSLASLVTSYESAPFSGIAFYVVSLLGGASLVATYLFVIYGAAAGTVYAVGKIALNNAIKDGAQRRRRLQDQHYHQQ